MTRVPTTDEWPVVSVTEVDVAPAGWVVWCNVCDRQVGGLYSSHTDAWGIRDAHARHHPEEVIPDTEPSDA